MVGMMHSYVMRHDPDAEPVTDPVLAPYADLEIPDTLYISSLALHEGWRGQGLGVQFLAHARQRAEHLGLIGLSLIDYAANTGALRFYERHGFPDCRQLPDNPAMLGVTGKAYLMQYP